MGSIWIQYGPNTTRRGLLKGALAGTGLIVLPAILAACGSDAKSSSA